MNPAPSARLEDRPLGLSGQTAVPAVEDRERQARSPSAMTGGTPVFRYAVRMRVSLQKRIIVRRFLILFAGFKRALQRI